MRVYLVWERTVYDSEQLVAVWGVPEPAAREARSRAERKYARLGQWDSRELAVGAPHNNVIASFVVRHKGDFYSNAWVTEHEVLGSAVDLLAALANG